MPSYDFEIETISSASLETCPALVEFLIESNALIKFSVWSSWEFILEWSASISFKILVISESVFEFWTVFSIEAANSSNKESLSWISLYFSFKALIKASDISSVILLMLSSFESSTRLTKLFKTLFKSDASTKGLFDKPLITSVNSLTFTSKLLFMLIT